MRECSNDKIREKTEAAQVAGTQSSGVLRMDLGNTRMMERDRFVKFQFAQDEGREDNEVSVSLYMKKENYEL
jgi:hypothetical protein